MGLTLSSHARRISRSAAFSYVYPRYGLRNVRMIAIVGINMTVGEGVVTHTHVASCFSRRGSCPAAF